MQFLDTYTNLGLNTEDQVFDYIIENLKPSNMLWSYFVDWEAVFNNTRKIEVSLNILNYLIGKEDFDTEFKELIKEHPQIVSVIPSLVVRDGGNSKKFKILVDFKNKKLVYEDFDFTKKQHTDEDIERYLMFVKETRIKELIQNKHVKNLTDYMIGVEAGLSSNGRKNRGGKSMEYIVEAFVADIAKRNGYQYLREANAQKIKDEFRIKVPVDKSSRRYDFAIKANGELYLIETNFYGGGGTKLKSTAGEYQGLNNTLKKDGFNLIWITDGNGWKTTRRPLREAFSNNDYVLSLSLLENGALDEILASA